MRLMAMMVVVVFLAGCVCSGYDPGIPSDDERGQENPGHAGKPGENKLISASPG